MKMIKTVLLASVITSHMAIATETPATPEDLLPQTPAVPEVPQEPQEPVMRNVMMSALCGNTTSMIEDLVSYALAPVVQSKTSRIFSEDSEVVPGMTTIWMSKTQGNFAVTFTPDALPDMTCMLTLGENLTPFGQPKKRGWK